MSAQVPGPNGNGKVGSDVISVKMIYKPATFRPIGPAAILSSTVDRTFAARNRCLSPDTPRPAKRR